jgi:predicted permease
MTDPGATGPDRRVPELPPEIEALLGLVLEAADLELTDGRREVERELRAHFEDGLAAGATADELIVRFGDPVAAGRIIKRTGPRAAARRRGETGRWWMSMREWTTEAVRAVRRLRRAPGFTAVVVLTLALGVGVNTAIFSVLNAVLLEDLPYAEPDRLVRVYERYEDWGDLEYMRGPIISEVRTWDEIFEDVAALYTYRETGADLTDGDAPVRVNVLSVSSGYFETLGRPPLMGRVFVEEESWGPGSEEDAEPAVAVLSHGLWRDHFGEAPDIVGRTVELDGEMVEVVGVMPPAFRDPFGTQADVWVPQNMRASGGNNFGNFYLSTVARLRDGVRIGAVQERLDVLGDAFVEREPEAESGRTTIRPLQADVVGDTRRTMLWILAAAAALVLLTACVNVANLLFARGLGQDRAFALRSALGSGRGRLIASTLLENGILAALGGAAGLGLGWLGVRALLGIAPDALPDVSEVTFGIPVFGFAFAVTVTALIVFGLTPALRMSRTAPADVLRSGDRASTTGRVVRRIRDGLVIVQVAAALVLVAGAALLTRSFDSLLDVPLAIEPQGVVTFEVHLPRARYPEPADRVRFHETLHERLLGLGAVTDVGAVSWLPVNGRYHSWGFYWDPENADRSNDEAWYNTDVRTFQGDWFDAMGVRLVRGVPPSAIDLDTEPVAWVNEELVRSVMPGLDPLRQTIWLADEERRIAGVVADVPWSARGDVSRKAYVPHRQADSRNWALIQTVRAEGDLGGVLDAARAELRSIDPNLVLFRPQTFGGILATVRAQDRFATMLMSAFGLLALVLSLVGTYGVLVASVASRTREIGIRMALGADTSSVRSLVVRYAAALTVPGIALGLAGAFVANRWIEALLFGVGAGDPVAYAAAIGAFVVVGSLAAWLPIRRATRVDTITVLGAD